MKNIYWLIVLAFGSFSILGYANDPVGIEGQSWARADFEIRSDAIVRVTAANQTINAHRGNSSTVIIKVNGVIKRKIKVHAAYSSASFDVKGKGAYKIIVLCTNELADASSCIVNHEKINVSKIY